LPLGLRKGWTITTGAIAALVNIGDKRAVMPLISVFREKDYATRAATKHFPNLTQTGG